MGCTTTFLGRVHYSSYHPQSRVFPYIGKKRKEKKDKKRKKKRKEAGWLRFPKKMQFGMPDVNFSLRAIVKKNNKVCFVEYAFLNYDMYIHLTEGGGNFPIFLFLFYFLFFPIRRASPQKSLICS